MSCRVDAEAAIKFQFHPVDIPLIRAIHTPLLVLVIWDFNQQMMTARFESIGLIRLAGDRVAEFEKLFLSGVCTATTVELISLPPLIAHCFLTSAEIGYGFHTAAVC